MDQENTYFNGSNRVNFEKKIHLKISEFNIDFYGDKQIIFLNWNFDNENRTVLGINWCHEIP
jgi:hypothetical protein